VISADRIEDWVAKGEVIDRYFNPGDVFSEVTLLLLAPDDDPPEVALKRMVGSARLEVLKSPLLRRPFFWTLGWRPPLARLITRGAVAVADSVEPDVVRCYGASMNAVVARGLKRTRGVPYLVSLHINPLEDFLTSKSFKSRISTRLEERLVRGVLRDADLVLPVYSSIEPYLSQLGISGYEVAYNMLNSIALRAKAAYQLQDPPRLLSVGRQFERKNPINVIRALARIPDATLTLVGDGQLHDQLRGEAVRSGVADRVTFIRSLGNDDLCAMLPDFDIFVTHSEYREISKAGLEALLAGLPFVLNRREGAAVPELTDEICLLVENSPEGYLGALTRLLNDHGLRERLGQSARRVALERWSPEAAEQRYAELYVSLCGATST